METVASNSWSKWLGEENSELRKASNHHKREDLQAQKQPCLTDEWTAFLSKAGKLSKKEQNKNAKNEETKQEPRKVEDGGGHQGMAPSTLQKK